MTKTNRFHIFVILVIAVVCIPSLQAKGEKPVRIRIYDTMAFPEKGVWLRVEVTRSGFLGIFRRPLKNAGISFLDRSSLIGRASTDKRGVASVFFEAPPNPGLLEYTAAFDGTDRFAPEKKTGRLYILNPDNPLIVCSADRIIAGASSREILTKDPEQISPRPFAEVALQQLSYHYNLLYFTEENEEYVECLTSWMRIKLIPLAPVIIRKRGLSPLSSGDSEKDLLSGLEKKNLELEAGISDTKADARWFLSHGMKALIFGYEKSDPGKIEPVSEWKTIPSLPGRKK